MALSVGALVAYLKLDDGDFRRGMDNAEGALGGLAKIAAGAGLAAGAALAASAVQAMDFQDANAKLSAQLGLSKDESAKIGKQAGAIYAGNYGDSLEDVNNAILGITQNVGEGSAKWLDATTKNVLSLSSAFDQESGDISKAVGQLLNTGLADSSEQALDIIAKGFQNGNDKAGDWLDTLNEYGTQFRKMGISGQEATGLISQGLQAGARDGDLVADAIKEFSIRATDGSKTSAAGFEALGLSAEQMTAQIAGGGENAKAGLDVVLDRLRAMKDPVAQSAAAVSLFGTQSEDLGAALYAIDPSTAVSGLGQVAGAADKVNATLGATASGNLESFKRQAQVAFVDIVGGKVLPILTTAATFLATNLSPAIDDVSTALGFVGEHSTVFGIVAGLITAVFLPALVAMGVQASIAGAKTAAAWLVTQAGAITAIAAQSLAVATTVGGWVLMGAQSLIQAARIAAAWLIAMGPIGLVIAAVVGLTVVIVKNWDTIRDAISTAWNWLRDNVFVPIGTFFTTTIPGWADTLRDNVVRAWGRLRDDVGAAWAWVRDQVLVPIGTFFVTTVPGWANTLQDNVSRRWQDMRDKVGAAWSWIRDQVLIPLGTFFTVTVPGYATTARDKVGDAWDGIKGKISGPIDWIRTQVFDPWRTAMTETLPGMFTTAVDAIGRAWDKVKDAAKEPVRFYIDTIINRGILGTVRSIGKFFGMSESSLPRDVPIPFAQGGFHEDHTAQIARPGAMRLWAEPETGGEAYIPLAQSKRGRSSAILADVAQRFGYGLTPFANGGVLDWLKSTAGSAADMAREGVATVRSAAGKVIDAVQDPVGYLREKIGSVLGGAGSSGMGQIVKAAGSKLLDTVAGSLKDLAGGAGLGGGSFTRGGGQSPDGRGGLGPVAAAARAFVQKTFGVSNIGGYANRNIAGTGVKSDHATGHALDIMMTPDYKSAQKRALGNRIASWFVENPDAYGTKYVIYYDQINSGKGWRPYRHPSGASSDTLQHRDHVHTSFYADGTRAAARGLAVVGERGPELVSFRGGERVYSNQETRGMLSGPKVEKHLHYYAATGRTLPEEDLADAAGRARMLGW